MFHCTCNPPASYHIYTNRSALNLWGKKRKKKAFCYCPRSSNWVCGCAWLIWPSFSFCYLNSMAQCTWCPERDTPPFSRKNSPRAGNSLLSPFPQKHSNVTKPTQSCRRSASKKNNRDVISFGLNGELGEDCAFGGERYHQCYQQQDFTFGQINRKWGQNWPAL